MPQLTPILCHNCSWARGHQQRCKLGGVHGVEQERRGPPSATSESGAIGPDHLAAAGGIDAAARCARHAIAACQSSWLQDSQPDVIVGKGQI